MRERTIDLVKKIQEHRDRLFTISFPVFANLAQEKRDFYLKIATIAAAIGSFSFLLPSSDLLKNPGLLVVGDILLLFVVLLSAALFLKDLKNKSSEFHKSYYSVFEGWGKIADIGQKFYLGQIKEEEFMSELKKEFDSIPSYNRPAQEQFKWESLLLVLFTFALISISLSLIPIQNL